MKRLSERLQLARIVLAELSKAGPLRWTQLSKRTLKQCGTPATFKSILNFLKQQGLIEKTSAKLTAPYIITQKGKRFLEGL